MTTTLVATINGIQYWETRDAGGNVVCRFTRQTPTTEEANDSTLRDRAITALAVNDTYLALGAPTTAQQTTQLARVTRECSGIIRLLLGRLDTVNGT